jgi:hypothetical protein
MSSDKERVENLTNSLNSIRKVLSKFNRQKLVNINDIKLKFYSLYDENRDIILNMDDTSLQILQGIVSMEISSYDDELVNYQIELLNQQNEQNLSMLSTLQQDINDLKTYNCVYKISNLDRLKEKYHIKYDTEESIVNYIISLYKYK